MPSTEPPSPLSELDSFMLQPLVPPASVSRTTPTRRGQGESDRTTKPSFSTNDKFETSCTGLCDVANETVHNIYNGYCSTTVEQCGTDTGQRSADAAAGSLKRKEYGGGILSILGCHQSAEIYQPRQGV